MRVRVLLFGPAARAVGATSVELNVEALPTLALIRSRLSVESPALEPFLTAGRFAVNQRYASDETEVAARDEIALIAMVSGG